jgi:ADP-ribosylglycohydrolase
MLGAIAGDFVGSTYEFGGCIKTKFFPLTPTGSKVTDDSVLTVAQMEQILDEKDWVDTLKEWTREFPRAGYGGNFRRWAMSEQRSPYQSWGNGSAMRVSPVAWAHDDETSVLQAARASAVATHSHEEGIRGAQATALAIFLARKGASKEELKGRVEDVTGYDLGRTLEEIRPGYQFDVSCQGSVPESLISFLESEDFEDAIRNAVSLGGDTDTMACIAGGVAEAFYGRVPEDLGGVVWEAMPERMRGVVRRFYERFGDPERLPSI